ncbi:MAG: CBS domain-containing protein [Phaeodactylibacter sp.]|nr:CBS domain-containing protein [Phaeodactylibacter sp.]
MQKIDPHTTLAAVMTTDLVLVSPKDTVKEVDDIFRKHNIHHIPVVSGMGELQGIISKADLLKISHGWGIFRKKEQQTYNDALFEMLLAEDIMTKNVACLEPMDTVEVAVGIFKENLFHAIPVVSGGIVVGLVTTFDLLNYAFREV